ncbi:hypothetical protein [Mesorhizobium huakuii]|uniref:hypothetical protein n=1 Tax=Mesorhizobium huakuii TaxID=28104 RepID=UPI0024E0E77C|nr:hypothetical protein [Mesorhizobium huakuii]
MQSSLKAISEEMVRRPVRGLSDVAGCSIAPYPTNLILGPHHADFGNRLSLPDPHAFQSLTFKDLLKAGLIPNRGRSKALELEQQKLKMAKHQARKQSPSSTAGTEAYIIAAALAR